ncbi:hypothetical protein [Massilia brevitalea]|uniref:hypothetical protein n=1 Tax=Massilia brevitalea TaxID=442526 RepID=UPI0027388DBA|nr:hypothetical protein [Massilia brevitalea]
MNNLPFSKSQALRAIKDLDDILTGNIRDHVLTEEMVEQLQASKDHLKAVHEI